MMDSRNRIQEVRERLTSIKSRAEKSTPGPWEVVAFDSGHSQFEMCVSIVTADYGDSILDMDGLARSDNTVDALDDGLRDAHFISHAREDVPALVEALTGVLDVMDELDVARSCGDVYTYGQIQMKLRETIEGIL